MPAAPAPIMTTFFLPSRSKGCEEVDILSVKTAIAIRGTQYQGLWLIQSSSTKLISYEKGDLQRVQHRSERKRLQRTSHSPLEGRVLPSRLGGQEANAEENAQSLARMTRCRLIYYRLSSPVVTSSSKLGLALMRLRSGSDWSSPF